MQNLSKGNFVEFLPFTKCRQMWRENFPVKDPEFQRDARSFMFQSIKTRHWASLLKKTESVALNSLRINWKSIAKAESYEVCSVRTLIIISFRINIQLIAFMICGIVDWIRKTTGAWAPCWRMYNWWMNTIEKNTQNNLYWNSREIGIKLKSKISPLKWDKCRIQRDLNPIPL